MARFKLEQRFEIVKTYFECKGYMAATLDKLRIKFGRNKAPTRKTIMNLVNKMRRTGMLVDATRVPHNRPTRTIHTIAAVAESVRQNPRLSPRVRSEQIGISVTTMRRILSEDLGHTNMTSKLAEITNYPTNPIEFFKTIMALNSPGELTMNLSTTDSEFGVLNRTVLYRGLLDDGIIYVTQSYTRNCENIQENPKVCVTFYLPQLQVPTDQNPSNWQIRLLDAKATKLEAIGNEEHRQKLTELWAEEPVHAKVRAHICKCGEPVNYAELTKKHDNFYANHVLNKSSTLLAQYPETYTAFKLEAARWDFYKSGDYMIADRVQYRKEDNGQWEVMHVAT